MKNPVICCSTSAISEDLQNGKKRTEIFCWKTDLESNCGNEEAKQCIPDKDVPPRIITQVLSTIVVALTHMGIGTVFAFSGITFPQLTNETTQDIFLTTNDAALFGSLIIIGAAVGSTTSGFFVVRFGQRCTLLGALPISLCSWILQAISPNVQILLLSRFALGLTTGLISIASYTLVLELSHKSYRGLLCCLIPAVRQFGYFFLASVGNSSLNWREMSLVCGFVTLVPPFLGLFFLHNSPRWLVSRGRINDAEESLLFYRGSKYDVTSELNDIVKQVNKQESSKQSSFTQLRLLRNKSILPKFLTILFITMGSSFNGNFVISAYLVPIFQSLSSDVNPYTGAMMIGAVKVTGTLLSSLIVDRVGRRPLLIGPYLINGICLVLVGSYLFAEDQGWDVEAYGWIPLTLLVVYTFFLCSAVSGTSLLRGELLPNSVRTTGYSILVTSLFMGGFVVTLVYPQTTAAVGAHGAFWIYGGCCILISIFCFFALPETRGQSLEEIASDQKDVSSQNAKV